MEVKHFAVLGQGLKAVREILWYQERLMVLRTQELRVPAQESRRISTQIHGDIEDFAAKTADKFGFRVRRILEMQTSHNAAPDSQRVIDLDNVFPDHQGLEFFRTKHSLEIASIVTNRPAPDQFERSQRRIKDVKAGTQDCDVPSHAPIWARLKAAISWPPDQALCHATVRASASLTVHCGVQPISVLARVLSRRSRPASCGFCSDGVCSTRAPSPQSWAVVSAIWPTVASPLTSGPKFHALANPAPSEVQSFSANCR